LWAIALTICLASIRVEGKYTFPLIKEAGIMFFEFSQKTKDLQERLSAFMDTYIYPNEAEFHRQVREGDPWKVIPLIEELKEKAT
jgi:hypothetical protein